MTDTPITSGNAIQEWLDHPTGGPALRAMLAEGGSDPSALGPALGLPLGALVAMSGGQLPQEAVDGLVRAANGGEMPAEETAAREAAAGGGATASGARFVGKTVIVTGAAGGIGRATAERLLAEGARVIATDVAAAKLEDFKTAAGTDALVTVVADLTQPDAVAPVLQAAGERVDGLANVAGINDDFSAIHEVSDAMWAKVFAVNVEAVVRLTRAVTGRMLESGGGAVVNVASEAGLRGSASGVAYTASKHAIIGITKSSAFMYAKSGIRTNAVAPGGVATGIPVEAHLGEFGSKRLEEARINIPGLSVAEQQAAAIAFLLSDDASNINGAVLANDGGWSAV